MTIASNLQRKLTIMEANKAQTNSTNGPEKRHTFTDDERTQLVNEICKFSYLDPVYLT